MPTDVTSSSQANQLVRVAAERFEQLKVLVSCAVSAYCASKWGVRGLLATIAEEANGDGVRTTAICPGFPATPTSGFSQAPPSLISIGHIVETVRRLLRLRPVVSVQELVLDRLAMDQ